MIAYCRDAAWHFLTQRSHGLLAGQVCAAWKRSDRFARWVETLIAATEQDDVYNELLRNPLLDSNGAPLNFKEMLFELRASEELIAMALAKSRFIALLVSMHIDFTHSKEASAQAFLKRIRAKEKKWLKEADSSSEEIGPAYGLLEFCDAFSLLICQDIIPTEGRTVVISSGPDGTVHSVRCCDAALVVEPWPFEDAELVWSYELRRVEKLGFASDDALRRAFQVAPVELRRVRVKKAKAS